MINTIRSAVLCGQIVRGPTKLIFNTPRPMVLPKLSKLEIIPQSQTITKKEENDVDIREMILRKFEIKLLTRPKTVPISYEMRSKRHEKAKKKRARRKDGKKTQLK